MTKIIRNAVGCLLCGDSIESKTRHDFKTCLCGNISVDGGKAYFKRGINLLEVEGNPTFIDL